MTTGVGPPEGRKKYGRRGRPYIPSGVPEESERFCAERPEIERKSNAIGAKVLEPSNPLVDSQGKVSFLKGPPKAAAHPRGNVEYFVEFIRSFPIPKGRRTLNSRSGRRNEGPFLHRNKTMSSLCKKAGVKPFGFYALGHFESSVLDYANVGLGSIQRILGHENRSTTEIYLHSIGRAERVAMEVFELFSSDSTQETAHLGRDEKEKGSATAADPLNLLAGGRGFEPR